ncbi:MAG: 2-succinyl-5-enolpyruvyl-6-hydroxy-3-cyclohexene-1-carboxylic-acid synthase [Actinomycetota bacterium]
MAPEVAALRCAEALLRSLYQKGMQEVIISPGSRSAPLVLAASALGLRTHVILDERSAAFFGLGAAERSGRPVGVICTSGTAAVNHGPAVVEADARGIRLVAITADRPPDLHGIGANQTIQQTSLHSRWATSIELPVAGSETSAEWTEAGHRIATRGPTHINAPFAEPFIPTGMMPIEPVDLSSPRVETSGGQTVADEPAAMPEINEMLDALGPDPETLLSIGPGAHPEDVSAMLRFAERAGLPVLASAIGGARRPGTLGAMVFDEAFVEPFDLVLHVGGAHTTRGVLRHLEAAAGMITWDERGRIQDPSARLRPSVTVRGRFEPGILDAVRPRGSRLPWLVQLEQIAQRVLSESESQLSEPMVARLSARGLDDHWLMVGNSTPVRDLERCIEPHQGRVTSNRGASGIDGVVSTICGSAAHGPVRGLVGDLSVLHDASGLLWLAPQSSATLAVLDNGGGGIFDLLPSAGLPEHERFFRTPHQGRLDRLLQASGAEVVTITTTQELVSAWSLPQGPSMRVLHVKIDRDDGLRRREELVTEIRRAFAAI